MDDRNQPNARRKKIVGEGKGVEKKGEGLGTGPVNNMGNYADRREQQQSQNAQRPAQSAQHPAQSSFGQSTQRPQQTPSSRPAQSPFGQSAQRPTQKTFGQNAQRPSQSAQSPFGQSSQRPAAQSPFGQSSQRPAQSTQRPAQSSSAQRPQQSSSARPAQTGGTRATSSGGGGKLILILLAVVAIVFFGRNAIFGGDNGSDTSLLTTTTQSQTQTQTQTQTQPQNVSSSDNTAAQGSSLMNLLSSFLGSAGSSDYDFTGVLSGLTGSSSGTGTTSSSDQYFTTSMENNTSDPDTTVASAARDKFTVIKGGKKDQITIMVYMCGTDLESQNGMGTADLKEMVSASLSSNVNLLVYTGGCRKWRNNVVSSSVNQIYQIKDGSLVRLEENMGTASMTEPKTLASFIQYGSKNFPANRMCLIFWDHGGGSVSGYGYDERYGQSQSMTLAGINEALKSGGVQFDFIGFDACLMATVENGLMLSQYADYMIASEETEPGVGWYYTNWLTKLSSNPSMATVSIGKIITDDFVEVCNKQCRGQATTLSVVDLAELAATVPTELKRFSIDTNELIQNNEYKKVSAARSNTREFAQQTRIDQIDLVHFAKNLATDESKSLAQALQGAVKYNRTGGGISNAYGLSIYFPYKKAGQVNKMVSTYKAIGMDDEYTRCIQEFASLEVSGQLSAGTSVQSYGSSGYASSGLLSSLMGSSGSYYGEVSNGYSASGLESLLGGLFGGDTADTGNSSGATGSILDLFMGRSMTAEKAAAYILENHFDPSALVWSSEGRITLSPEQWSNIAYTAKNVFYDDGKGFIDLGMDSFVVREGDDLVYEFDGTWLSLDRQPVPYYFLDRIQEGSFWAETGYVPVLLNGTRANLILVFDQDHEDGYIAGAQQVYTSGETEVQPKNMIQIGKGDKVQAICDYFDYEGKYLDSYPLGDEFVLGDETEIGWTYVDQEKCRVTYCLTDYYQQNYWTPEKK